MPRIQCFMLEPTGKVSIKLRRYSKSDTEHFCPLDPSTYSYHNAFTFIGQEPEEHNERGYTSNGLKPVPGHDDTRWPKTCPCGYIFQDGDEWQRFTETIYRRSDSGEETTIRDAPAGAMWFAWWMDNLYMPQGEHNLVVKTPGGDWSIDGQANNCTMPEDMNQKQHHCWIRHGTPPDVTVDKSGQTCGAGAGSIQCGNYHGFLRNGYLED